jgi:hypothetical protein
VHTSASDHAIWGVLVQDKHPIAFELKAGNGRTQRCGTVFMIREVLHVLDNVQHYWLGTTLTVVTDNVANTDSKASTLTGVPLRV